MVFNGHAVVVTQLITTDFKVDTTLTTNGATPLFVSTQGGHESVTKQLIKARCNVDLGAKALHVAVFKGYEGIIKQIIASRCNVDIRTKKGYTPLHCAAGYACDCYQAADSSSL